MLLTPLRFRERETRPVWWSGAGDGRRPRVFRLGGAREFRRASHKRIERRQVSHQFLSRGLLSLRVAPVGPLVSSYFYSTGVVSVPGVPPETKKGSGRRLPWCTLGLAFRSGVKRGVGRADGSDRGRRRRHPKVAKGKSESLPPVSAESHRGVGAWGTVPNTIFCLVRGPFGGRGSRCLRSRVFVRTMRPLLRPHRTLADFSLGTRSQ